MGVKRQTISDIRYQYFTKFHDIGFTEAVSIAVSAGRDKWVRVTFHPPFIERF